MASPQHVFLFCASLVGLALIVVTPPSQVPDEPNHFQRAYQVSTGQLLPETVDRRVGGVLPHSILMTPARFLIGRDEKVTAALFRAEWARALEPERSQFVDFPGSALYSPVPYLPHAAGIALGRMVGFGPLALFYIARLFNFLTWLTLVYLAIRLAPTAKWLMCLLGLVPMHLFVVASNSADAVTNGLAFLSVAWFMRLAWADRPLRRWRDLGMGLLLVILLSLCKGAFGPIAGLVLLIPPQRLGLAWWARVLLALGFLVTSVAAFWLWSEQVRPMHLDYEQYNPKYRAHLPLNRGVDTERQMVGVIKNPVGFLKIVAVSLYNDRHPLSRQFYGNLGWLELQIPPTYLYAYFALLVWVAAVEPNRVVPTHQGRCLLVGAGLAVIVAIAFLMYCAWVPLGGTAISGWQGRYFMPAALLLWCAAPARIADPRDRWHRRLAILVVLMVCLNWIEGFRLLVERYYLG